MRTHFTPDAARHTCFSLAQQLRPRRCGACELTAITERAEDFRAVKPAVGKRPTVVFCKATAASFQAAGLPDDASALLKAHRLSVDGLAPRIKWLVPFLEPLVPRLESIMAVLDGLMAAVERLVPVLETLMAAVEGVVANVEGVVAAVEGGVANVEGGVAAVKTLVATVEGLVPTVKRLVVAVKTFVAMLNLRFYVRHGRKTGCRRLQQRQLVGCEEQNRSGRIRREVRRAMPMALFVDQQRIDLRQICHQR